MADEVERKFRVRSPAGLPALGDGTQLRQAYVAVDGDGDVEVRVRDQGGEHMLTVKGGHGLRRTEVELSIGAGEFDELWALAPDRRIEKTRHRVDLEVEGRVEGRVAEVDVYGGSLDGLVVVEVEFASSDDAEGFTPPPWFGDEVTGDRRWSNASLATSGLPPHPPA